MRTHKLTAPQIDLLSDIRDAGEGGLAAEYQRSRTVSRIALERAGFIVLKRNVTLHGMLHLTDKGKAWFGTR